MVGERMSEGDGVYVWVGMDEDPSYLNEKSPRFAELVVAQKSVEDQRHFPVLVLDLLGYPAVPLVVVLVLVR